MGRVTDINDSSGTALAHYAYDSLGRRAAVAYANGTAKEYSYDTAYRLADVTTPPATIITSTPTPMTRWAIV